MADIELSLKLTPINLTEIQKAIDKLLTELQKLNSQKFKVAIDTGLLSDTVDKINEVIKQLRTLDEVANKSGKTSLGANMASDLNKGQVAITDITKQIDAFLKKVPKLSKNMPSNGSVKFVNQLAEALRQLKTTLGSLTDKGLTDISQQLKDALPKEQISFLDDTYKEEQEQAIRERDQALQESAKKAEEAAQKEIAAEKAKTEAVQETNQAIREGDELRQRVSKFKGQDILPTETIERYRRTGTTDEGEFYTVEKSISDKTDTKTVTTTWRTSAEVAKELANVDKLVTAEIEKINQAQQKFSSLAGDSNEEVRQSVTSLEALKQSVIDVKTQFGETKDIDQAKTALTKIDTQFAKTTSTLSSRQKELSAAAKAESDYLNVHQKLATALASMEKYQSNGKFVEGFPVEDYQKLQQVMTSLEGTYNEGKFNTDALNKALQESGTVFTEASEHVKAYELSLKQASEHQKELTKLQSLQTKFGEAKDRYSQFEGVDGKYGAAYDEIKNKATELADVLTNSSLSTQELAQKNAELSESYAKNVAVLKQNVDEQRKALQVDNQRQNVIARAQKDLENFTAAQDSSNDTSKKAYTTIGEQQKALEGLKGQYDNNAINITQYENAVKSASNTIKEQEQIIRKNGDAHEDLGKKVSGVAKKFATWLTSAQAVMTLVRALRKMISTAIEVDDAMTQMQIVTRATDTQMRQFGDTAAEAAQKVGSSITDFVDSATTFARLGYSMDESSQLAQFTGMLQNVGKNVA